MSDSFQSKGRMILSALRPTMSSYQLEIAKQQSDEFGYELIVQNQTSGVRFEWSPREGCGWHVVVARLVDHYFPKHPIFIRADTPINRFDLRDVSSFRRERLSGLLLEKVLNDVQLDESDVAELLVVCCDDILCGDFRVFEKLEPIVKGRSHGKQ